MLSIWWSNLLGGLGHYFICPGAVAQMMVMTNNIMTLGYTYAKRSINNHPNFFRKIVYIGQLIAWIPSRLTSNPTLRGRDQCLPYPSLPKVFNGTNNQKGPTAFDTYTRYTLWYSVYTNSVNPCFELYTE